jgi:hypothetical protein
MRVHQIVVTLCNGTLAMEEIGWPAMIIGKRGQHAAAVPLGLSSSEQENGTDC